MAGDPQVIRLDERRMWGRANLSVGGGNAGTRSLLRTDIAVFSEILPGEFMSGEVALGRGAVSEIIGDALLEDR